MLGDGLPCLKRKHVILPWLRLAVCMRIVGIDALALCLTLAICSIGTIKVGPSMQLDIYFSICIPLLSLLSR